MLYLGEQHIRESISLDEVMDTIEKSFQVYESGDFQMPDRMHVEREEGTILYMPSFTKDVFGTKIISTFPENIKKGVPTVQATMVLNKASTGEPIAIFDGAALTAYRTGAVGGVGVRYTTRENCESVGLIGTGVQGFHQLLFACTARKIKNIYIFDRSKERLISFKEKLEKRIKNVKVNIVDKVEELVLNSEIIITATPAESPVLPDNEEMLKGKHIIAIGSYKLKMRELPKALYTLLDDVYIDTKFAAEESGDIIVPVREKWIKEDQIKIFGELLGAKKPINEKGGTSLYKSVGMGLFDLMVAEAIYNKAIKLQKGQKIQD
ncbi:ornithine cyclodeaminase family protein [Clostridium oceanicum]|uniref:Ornithine cyclodeaminase family protein n=1 Tax=Clostridium oceanicum TaxID=1543 RepID=A0ABP3UTD6_9CLOT